MPRKIKITRKQALVRLHKQLLTRRDALRRALNGDLESLRELGSMDVGDNADAAVDTVNDELNSQLVEIESRELEMIEAALKKIENGTYGSCALCGSKIAAARLNALPYTTTCIECQREQEEGGGYVPRPMANQRWAEIGDNNFDEQRDTAEFNINDFEVDVSESGR